MRRVKGESFQSETLEGTNEATEASSLEKLEYSMLKMADETEKWLKDYFRGIPSEKFEPEETTNQERVQSTVKIKLKNAAKFLGLHLPMEVPAYLLQKFIFKPRERRAIADTLRTGEPAPASYGKMEERIATSEHLKPETKFELLNDLSALADPELSRIDWIDIIGVDGSIEQDWTVADESRLDEEFVSQVETVLKRHIDTEISGKKLLIDAVLTALVFKGGAVLKPLGMASKKVYLAVKGIKAAKALNYSIKETKSVWNAPSREAKTPA